MDYDFTKYNLENGTSCAAPLVAAMFNRIVEERIRAGKKGPLGFVNPVLYQHPEIFKDVVKGENGLCAPDQGFQVREALANTFSPLITLETIAESFTHCFRPYQAGTLYRAWVFLSSPN